MKKLKKNFPDEIIMRIWLQYIEENGLPTAVERISCLLERQSKKLKIKKTALAQFTKEQYSSLFKKIMAGLEKISPKPEEVSIVRLNEIAMLVMKAQLGTYDGLSLTLVPKKALTAVKDGAEKLGIPEAELAVFTKVLYAELHEKIGLALDEFIIKKK